MIIRAKTPTQLTSLNLAGRNLNEIPAEVFGCTNLRKLDLSNNHLCRIPKEICKLTKLEVLNLSGNQLKQLHAGLFSLVRLRTLVIANNSIKSLPPQFVGLSKLRVLMMQKNNITFFDPNILSKSITKLNISGNNIGNVEWVVDFPNLKQFWMANLPIAYSDAMKETAVIRRKGVKVFTNNPPKTDTNKASATSSLSQPRPDIAPDKTNPKVCISYSWDDEPHKLWVLGLADKLTANGIHVYFDRYDLVPGSDSNLFMEEMLAKSEKAIIVATPIYKEKAEKRKAGAGYEYSIISSEIFENQRSTKFIPIIRRGSKTESVPKALQSKITIPMQDDSKFEMQFEELCRTIIGKPKIKRPQLGKIPEFD
jgi:Leucine-rich repeat (LRR) protein